MNILDTWYIEEGDSNVITLPSLRDGNEEGECLVVDDRGDLLLPCYVREAEYDGLLCLKQFGAARAVVERWKAAEHYGDLEVENRTWRITRREDGTYEVEEHSVDDLGDAM